MTVYAKIPFRPDEYCVNGAATYLYYGGSIGLNLNWR